MPTPRWLQHPVAVFLLPLITFLCLPQLYKLLPYGTDPSYDDTKLQRIASLMDDIYSILVNSTFIPHNAITRGPHLINTTAIPCKPSASVLRLMELLPYVDLSLVQEPDWIYGGHFMDYRNPEHLAGLCDPLRGQSIGWTDYMAPSDVALTNWGTGGWNNDRTWVMIYNTERDAIRIFDAEMWIEETQAQHEFGEEMEGWWFEDIGEWGMWSREDGAPHILRAIANNYRSLKWTPWRTSNREEGFGVPPQTIETLLQRNGWPNVFNSDHFNAEFIRAQHKPSGKGHAEAAHRLIDSLAGYNRTIVEDDITSYEADPGRIYYMQQRLHHHREALAKSADMEEQQLHEWRIQRTTWALKDLQADLETAQAEVATLCPDGACVKEEDMILWEFVALQRTHEEARYTNSSKKCEHQLFYYPSNDPEWLEKCIKNKATKRTWLDMAFEQSQTEALAHCEETGCELVPFQDVFSRVRNKIAEIERIIVSDTAGLERMETEYQHKIPEFGTKARNEFAMDDSALANGRWYLKDKIELLEDEMAKLERGEGSERERKWLFDYLRDDDED
ncbi:hypothetical protein BU25DRAFT_93929 [Macroventuria anomochaeta]|uniref:Uncharacterized protein n=1 Tax=Macroventuria anomochaeta TaxID=301207 RepID=A0ACB6RX06_9PLEO|nr:uncharacterized protein BU25DRAFT_93929 [Macroventuria anomochaeta]KAF2626313.1 hypothetical protein BU25DRAFT_93929 [Macroventuria anomochaeta]